MPLSAQRVTAVVMETVASVQAAVCTKNHKIFMREKKVGDGKKEARRRLSSLSSATILKRISKKDSVQSYMTS